MLKNGENGKAGGSRALARRAVLAKQPIIDVLIAGTSGSIHVNLAESATYVKSLNERRVAGLYNGKDGIKPLFCEIRYELLVAVDGDGSVDRTAMLEKKMNAQNDAIRGAIGEERASLGNNGLDGARATLVQVEQSLVTIPTSIITYLGSLKKKVGQGAISEEFRKKVESALANVEGLFAFYASFTEKSLELAELLFKTSQIDELVKMWKEIEAKR